MNRLLEPISTIPCRSGQILGGVHFIVAYVKPTYPCRTCRTYATETDFSGATLRTG
jgi:hypothetical protein